MDERLLSAALTIVARRHSALRTFFPRNAAPEHAACLRPEDVTWPIHTLDAYGLESQSGTGLERLFVPFSPEQPPLLRAALETTNTEEHTLRLAVDHLNFDGESIPVVARDLASAWNLLSSGTAITPLSMPCIQYEEFVRWQQDWVRRMGDKAFAYWMPRWGPAGLYPELPFPDPAEATIGGRAKIWEHPIQPAALKRLEDQIGVGHFTEFMLVAAALLRALNRRFALPAPGLLFPYANRVMEDSSTAVGYFNNRLLLRPILGEGLAFGKIAQEVRSYLMESLYYGSLPYTMIAERLFPETLGTRPRRKFLYFGIENAGQEYEIPGGVATGIPAEVDIDADTDPGVFVTYMTGIGSGDATLRCEYSPRFYAEADISEFMNEVLENLQTER